MRRREDIDDEEHESEPDQGEPAMFTGRIAAM